MPTLAFTLTVSRKLFHNLTCCLFVKSVSFESWLLISSEGPLSPTYDQKWSEWPNQWPPGPPGLLYLLSSSLSCLHCLFTAAHSLSWKSLNYKCKNQQTNQKNYNTNTSNKWNVQIFWGGLIIGWAFYIYLTTMKQKQLFVNVRRIWWYMNCYVLLGCSFENFCCNWIHTLHEILQFAGFCWSLCCVVHRIFSKSSKDKTG